MADYILEGATDTLLFYHITDQYAIDSGFKLTDEQKATMEAEFAEIRETYATSLDPTGEKQLDYILKYSIMDKESFMNISSVTSLGVAWLIDNVVPQPTQQEVNRFASDNGVYSARHILIKAEDPDSDESFAVAEAEINRIREELRAAEDSHDLFDTLMNEYSEDGRTESGALYAPEGYTFPQGQMVEEFYNGTADLQIGEVSEPIRSSYGYHIILRQDVTDESYVTGCAENTLVEEIERQMAEADIVLSPEYDSLDIKDCYEKLTEIREEIIALVEALEDPLPAE